jgi:hypothetical protein
MFVSVWFGPVSTSLWLAAGSEPFRICHDAATEFADAVRANSVDGPPRELGSHEHLYWEDAGTVQSKSMPVKKFDACRNESVRGDSFDLLMWDHSVRARPS